MAAHSVGLDMHSVGFDVMTLLSLPGVGPKRVRKILKRWEGGRGASLSDPRFLNETLTDSQMAGLPESRERISRQWDDLSKTGVRCLSLVEPDYPHILKRVLGEDSPVLLLCRGNLELLTKSSVGFCGSRAATEKGLATANDCADLLARENINVISGYATGVDMSAHRAALEAGGTTTIVLAEGILRFRLKKELQDDWEERRTLVVSEFGPNLPWSVGHAMQRNRTICALSRAMILIEAGATGGSIEAGRTCLQLSLPLFAAVYEGMPESATGNEELLRCGGKPLMKSRTTNRPNIHPILETIAAPPATVQADGFALKLRP